MKTLTIDEALAALKQAKTAIGGDKALVLSLTASGLADQSINGITIVMDGESNYVQIECLHTDLVDTFYDKDGNLLEDVCVPTEEEIATRVAAILRADRSEYNQEILRKKACDEIIWERQNNIAAR